MPVHRQSRLVRQLAVRTGSCVSAVECEIVAGIRLRHCGTRLFWFIIGLTMRLGVAMPFRTIWRTKVTYSLIRWAHVLVMGYWLGSELVINALTHYIARATSLSGVERMRLWDFVLDADQHVRNAMIMSVPLGFTLASILGLVPIEGVWMWLLWIASALWFWFMWLVHWRRKSPEGSLLARWDWRIRYVLIAGFVGVGGWSLATGGPLPVHWLALKVLLVPGAMACGIAVRYYIREAYRSALPAIAADRATAADNDEFRGLMVKATWALVVLWVILFSIGTLGALKPDL